MAKGKVKPHPISKRVLAESTQGHETRTLCIEAIEAELHCPLLVYTTSFVQPVQMDAQDVDMMEDLLSSMDLSNGFALLISSPGGDGLAAERIVHVCRQYSGTSEYWAIVAGRAKSAATIVCMGASKILMGPSSELGPIDPQIVLRDEGKRFSTGGLLDSYRHLFDEAVKTSGNLEPYLQQLDHYDARDIAEFQKENDLADDLAHSILSTGMMKGKTKAVILQKIKVFLNPKKKKVHGRSIYPDEAEKCGLVIDKYDPTSKLWGHVRELHVRLAAWLDARGSKLMETREESYGFANVGGSDGN